MKRLGVRVAHLIGHHLDEAREFLHHVVAGVGAYLHEHGVMLQFHLGLGGIVQTRDAGVVTGGQVTDRELKGEVLAEGVGGRVERGIEAIPEGRAVLLDLVGVVVAQLGEERRVTLVEGHDGLLHFHEPRRGDDAEVIRNPGERLGVKVAAGLATELFEWINGFLQAGLGYAHRALEGVVAVEDFAGHFLIGEAGAEARGFESRAEDFAGDVIVHGLFVESCCLFV